MKYRVFKDAETGLWRVTTPGGYTTYPGFKRWKIAYDVAKGAAMIRLRREGMREQ